MPAGLLRQGATPFRSLISDIRWSRVSELARLVVGALASSATDVQ